MVHQRLSLDWLVPTTMYQKWDPKTAQGVVSIGIKYCLKNWSFVCFQKVAGIVAWPYIRTLPQLWNNNYQPSSRLDLFCRAPFDLARLFDLEKYLVALLGPFILRSLEFLRFVFDLLVDPLLHQAQQHVFCGYIVAHKALLVCLLGWWSEWFVHQEVDVGRSTK